MILYISRRVINYLILTVVATCLAYMLASLTLDPTRQYRMRNPPAPPEVLESILNRLGVNPDVPLLVRTAHWFGDIFAHGSFGLGVNYQPVVNEMATRSVVSLQLLLIGSIIGAILGIVLGVWAAVRQYRLPDIIFTYTSYVIFAIPTIVMAILLMVLATKLNQALGFQLITFIGQYSPTAPPDFWSQAWDRISHALLPTLVLVLFGATSYGLYQRNSMLDVLGADYIRTARSKGRTRNSALIRHGVRLALIPMSTFLAYSFGTLVTGSTILEYVFSWHGMGELAIGSLQKDDINSIAGSTAYVAVLILCSSTLSEVLYAALDPRVRR